MNFCDDLILESYVGRLVEPAALIASFAACGSGNPYLNLPLTA